MAKISNDQFRELNAPVTLYAAKMNSWVIVIRRGDLLGELNSRGEAAALPLADQIVENWWRQVIGPQAVAHLRATGVMAAKGLPSGQRLQHVQPWPIEFSNDYVYVSFEFEPKGKLELPWPWQIGAFGSWDTPQSGLIATFKPHQVIEIPGVVDTLENTWTDIKDDAVNLKPIMYGIAAIIGLLVIREIKR